MYRHHPQTTRLAELVAYGAIGELRVIRAAFSDSLYDTETSGCGRTSRVAR